MNHNDPIIYKLILSFKPLDRADIELLGFTFVEGVQIYQEHRLTSEVIPKEDQFFDYNALIFTKDTLELRFYPEARKIRIVQCKTFECMFNGDCDYKMSLKSILRGIFLKLHLKDFNEMFHKINKGGTNE